MTIPTNGSSIQISSGAVTHNLTNSRTWPTAYALQFELMGDGSPNDAMQAMHHYKIRPRKDRRGADLVSDALPFGSLVVWRAERSQQRNRLCKTSQLFTQCLDSRCDERGNVIETHEH